jgi:hypothetical protein
MDHLAGRGRERPHARLAGSIARVAGAVVRVGVDRAETAGDVTRPATARAAGVWKDNYRNCNQFCEYETSK